LDQNRPSTRKTLKKIWDLLLAPFLSAFIRLKITPNALTLTGALLSLPASWCLSRGEWTAASLWLLAGGFFDVLDGALARALKSHRVFGAFLDSTMDRMSEAVVFLGLVLYYGTQGDGLSLGLAFTTAFLSQLISYTRARAEGLGVANEVGWVTRPVRILGLAAGLLLQFPTATLWILCLLSLVTVFQRIYHVYRQTKSGPGARPQKALHPGGRHGI